MAFSRSRQRKKEAVMGDADRFLGSWLVSEYVYTPDGHAIGVVHQRRELRRLNDHRIRVIQHCVPEPALDGHPMAAFAGEWVFDLSIEGRLRRYHGPDVVGCGEVWGEGMMIGRGLWPRFGKLFRSFAMLVTPDRQVTGGRFFVGPAPVACIVGVGVPEHTGASWPVLHNNEHPGMLATCWRGHVHRLSPEGVVIDAHPLERQYHRSAVTEATPARTVMLRYDRQKISGDGVGIGWRIGALFEGDILFTPEHSVTFLEVCDSVTRIIVGIRRHYRAGLLEYVETFQLTAGG
jgi:hypothetical protein